MRTLWYLVVGAKADLILLWRAKRSGRTFGEQLEHEDAQAREQAKAAAMWRARDEHCSRGEHAWMLGPFTADGKWVDEQGVHRPIPTDFHPYFCGFGAPWCDARLRSERLLDPNETGPRESEGRVV